MTDKIKLMSDETVLKIAENFPARVTHNMVRDECEKRATEKLKEVAMYFWEKAGDYEPYNQDAFNRCFQQFSNQKAINLLKEWKERDGSEIEENYQRLKKEQDGE